MRTKDEREKIPAEYRSNGRMYELVRRTDALFAIVELGEVLGTLGRVPGADS